MRLEGKEALESYHGTLSPSLSMALWGNETGCDERPTQLHVLTDALGSTDGSNNFPKLLILNQYLRRDDAGEQDQEVAVSARTRTWQLCAAICPPVP